MVLFPKDLEPMMPESEILNAINSSAATWSAGANDCTYLDVTVATSTDDAPRAVNDGRNNIVFRVKNWCKLTTSGGCDPAVPYDSAALALTSVSASTSSGIIRDADVEVNAFHFSWADLVAHPELQGMPYHDLQNAVTHEMGHVIGLDHTCFLQPPAPLDQNGNPIPDCMDAPPDVLATTMFPSADPGDIEKRTLAPDDLQGLCDIYPKAQDPMMCVPPQNMDTGCGGGGCATAGTPGSWAALLTALAVFALGARRRPRRS
jgi:MYXO-CTERM domain-containing protein